MDHRNAGRSVIQDRSSDHRFKRLHLTRASVRRASGFVLTGYPEVKSRPNSQLRGREVGFEEIAVDLLQARFWIASG